MKINKMNIKLYLKVFVRATFVIFLLSLGYTYLMFGKMDIDLDFIKLPERRTNWVSREQVAIDDNFKICEAYSQTNKFYAYFYDEEVSAKFDKKLENPDFQKDMDMYVNFYPANLEELKSIVNKKKKFLSQRYGTFFRKNTDMFFAYANKLAKDGNFDKSLYIIEKSVMHPVLIMFGYEVYPEMFTINMGFRIEKILLEHLKEYKSRFYNSFSDKQKQIFINYIAFLSSNMPVFEKCYKVEMERNVNMCKNLYGLYPYRITLIDIFANFSSELPLIVGEYYRTQIKNLSENNIEEIKSTYNKYMKHKNPIVRVVVDDFLLPVLREKTIVLEKINELIK